jgi:hypothetical protein
MIERENNLVAPEGQEQLADSPQESAQLRQRDTNEQKHDWYSHIGTLAEGSCKRDTTP